MEDKRSACSLIKSQWLAEGYRIEIPDGKLDRKEVELIVSQLPGYPSNHETSEMDRLLTTWVGFLTEKEVADLLSLKTFMARGIEGGHKKASYKQHCEACLGKWVQDNSFRRTSISLFRRALTYEGYFNDHLEYYMMIHAIRSGNEIVVHPLVERFIWNSTIFEAFYKALSLKQYRKRNKTMDYLISRIWSSLGKCDDEISKWLLEQYPSEPSQIHSKGWD